MPAVVSHIRRSIATMNVSVGYMVNEGAQSDQVAKHIGNSDV